MKDRKNRPIYVGTPVMVVSRTAHNHRGDHWFENGGPTFFSVVAIRLPYPGLLYMKAPCGCGEVAESSTLREYDGVVGRMAICGCSLEVIEGLDDEKVTETEDELAYVE